MMIRLRRDGFTLIEMLLVVTIVLILTVIVLPLTLRMQDRDRVPTGAILLQGSCSQARGRAALEKRPVGIRLIPSTANPNVCDQIEFIHEPEPFQAGFVEVAPNTNVVTNLRANFTGVLPGDLIEFHGGGQLYLITNVSGRQLTLDRPVPAPPGAQYAVAPPFDPPGLPNYRIFRQPRPIAGEKPMKLPADVVIDPAKSYPPNLQTLGKPPSILFKPSGGVTGSAAVEDMICLWLQDTTQGNDDNVALVVIYTRTGAVTNVPVNQGGDPFLHARTGRGSGSM
jgi:prepilin-type N-terminal cleavage/methylation domain-containing protein